MNLPLCSGSTTRLQTRAVGHTRSRVSRRSHGHRRHYDRRSKLYGHGQQFSTSQSGLRSFCSTTKYAQGWVTEKHCRICSGSRFFPPIRVSKLQAPPHQMGAAQKILPVSRFKTAGRKRASTCVARAPPQMLSQNAAKRIVSPIGWAECQARFHVHLNAAPRHPEL